jgi:transcriptional regulator with XRE-family HTH domain
MTVHARAPIDTNLMGRVLTGRLKHQGLSQRQAAPTIGVSHSVVARAARGMDVDLAAYTLICLWLGVSLDTFVQVQRDTPQLVMDHSP